MSIARRLIVFVFVLFASSSTFAQENPIAKVKGAISLAERVWPTGPVTSTSETKTEAEAKLREALLALDAQNSRRAAEFSASAAKALTPGATARLEAAKAAYAVSYVRLAAILRELLADPVPEGLDAKRPTLLVEASQILTRLEGPASQKPISQTLPVGSPPQQPPPIGVPSGSVTTLPIGQIPASLQTAADALPGVAEVYEYVRNGTKAEFYYGVMKGASETNREGSGNDADTAALLTQMIRAKGIAARYVRGVVELRSLGLTAMTGTASIEQAVRVFERAGIPHEVILGGGSVSSVRFERIWVEAYVPYANYRGSMLDAQGKTWIPLDAGFKPLVTPSGVDPASLGLDVPQIVADYLGAVQEKTPLEFAKERATALGTAAGRSYSDLINTRGYFGQVSGMLPNSLPYTVVSITERSYDLPETLQHTVRLIGTLNGETLLDFTAPTMDAIGKRFTLDYSPATGEEAELVSSYGGLLRTPPYLIEVKPTIAIGGVDVYAGSNVPMGVPFELRMEMKTPGGTAVTENRIQAGNTMAVGLGGAVQAAALEDDATAGQILSGLALRYFSSWNASDSQLADLLHVVPVRPTVSVCLVTSDVQVDYADGDPLLPVAWEWKGILIDADLRSTSPVGIATLEAEKRFVHLSGLEGSILENKVFEDSYQIPSVSTAKVLGMAAAAGIEILDITSSNLDLVGALPFTADVKAEVLDAAQRGRRVTIPAEPVTYLAWTGVGYLIQDDETLSAAYQLQGGHSGGVTAPSTISFPGPFPDIFKGAAKAPVSADPDKRVGRLRIVSASNFQMGTVGKRSNAPLRVFVSDGYGAALSGAAVTFQVMGGGGRLTNIIGVEGTASETVLSNKDGYAESSLIYGTRTNAIPRYLAPTEGQEHSVQAGLNLVTATAGLARLDEPFQMYGLPDERRPAPGQPATVTVVLKALQGGGWLNNLRVAGRMDIAVEDQYGNPLSNVPIRVKARPAEAGERVPVRELISDFGGVVNQVDYARCAALTPTVFKGECKSQPGPPATEGERGMLDIKSSALGVFAFVAMGASTASYYTFDVGTELTPNILWASYPTVGTFCVEGDCANAPFFKAPQAYTSATGPSILRNEHGDEVEAYLPGGTARVTFGTDVVRERDRVVPRGDKLYVEGTNEWYRERLEDSRVTLTAKTPGTVAQGEAAAVAGSPGEYEATVTMSGTPKKNSVEFEVRAFAPRPRMSSTGEVQPQYVEAGKLTPAGYAKDFTRPDISRSTFGLWGVRAGLIPLDPAPPEPIFLTPGNKTAHPSSINYLIEPAEWGQLLDPKQVLFQIMTLSGVSLLAASGTQGETFGSFSIPRDLPLTAGLHPATLTIQRVLGRNGLDLIGTGRQIQAGVIDLSVDTNNDTFVDDADDVAARNDASKPFVFWEGDTRLEPQDAITDYATVRVRLPFQQTRYDLELSLANSSFDLKKKYPDAGPCEGDEPIKFGKGHLCHAATYESQQESFENDPQPSRRGANAFVLSAGSLTPGANDFLMRCNARVDGTPACPARALYLSVIDRGGSQAISPTQPVATRSVSFEPFQRLASLVSLRGGSENLQPNDPSSPYYTVALDARVDTCPGNGRGCWRELPDAGQVEQTTLLVHGFNISDVDFRDGLPGRESCVQVREGERCTPRPSAGWYSQWAKRFYWAGHKVLREQKGALIGVSWPGDRPGKFGLLGGFVEIDVHLRYGPEDEFNALQAGLPLGRFITELGQRHGISKLGIFAHSMGNVLVNNALKEVPPPVGMTVNYVMHQAAVSADAFLDAYDPTGAVVPVATGVSDLVKHAQALGFPDPVGRGNNFPDGEWSDQHLILHDRVSGAACLNVAPYSLTIRGECIEHPDRAACQPAYCAPVGRYYFGQATFNPALGDGSRSDLGYGSSSSFFAERWAKKFTRIGAADGVRYTLRGPWTGFFLANTQTPRIRLFNTYNATDYVLRIDQPLNENLPAILAFPVTTPLTYQFLRNYLDENKYHAYKTAQILNKPFGTTTDSAYAFFVGRFQTGATDPISDQRWWTLAVSDRPSLWQTTKDPALVASQLAYWRDLAPRGAPDGAPVVPEQLRRHREWAELAFWYPALAPPVGVTTTPGVPAVRNIDFTVEGGAAGYDAATDSNLSHSFSYAYPLHRVWSVFTRVRAALATPAP